MSKIKIELEGPGGVVNYEIKTIIEALEATGVKVVLTDPYYEKPDFTMDRSTITVELSVHQMPWGG